jgi:parvulin-like peptidyl-prolyl isomerase
MTTTHGKYFARYTSDYGDDYELAAFDLRVNELSNVVETSDGYYIILRLELEEDYIKQNYDDFKDDVLGSEFNKILASYKSNLEFTLNDYGKSINILEIE